jgi:general secretion pathway protein G
MGLRYVIASTGSRLDRGFTIMEITITLALVALLSAMAVPAVTGYVGRARTNRAIGDIGRISIEIYKWRTNNGGALPASLDDTNIDVGLDPWRNAYSYLNISLAGPAAARKDKNLNPINTDFDLYSNGPDGQTARNLGAKTARDDIVRANNGGFVGVAEDY